MYCYLPIPQFSALTGLIRFRHFAASKTNEHLLAFDRERLPARSIELANACEERESKSGDKIRSQLAAD